MTSASTAYAVLAKQSGNAAHANTKLLSYLLGCRAGPIEIDHGLEIFGGEAVTQTSPTCSAAHLSTVRARVRPAVLLGLLRQDRYCFSELFSQVRAVRVSYQQVHHRP